MQKVVFITGGSTGIGKSVGEFLTQKGHISDEVNEDICEILQIH